MQAILLEGHVDIPAERLAEAIGNIPLYVAHARGEPGCLYFDMQASADVENRFIVTAKFENQISVDNHFKSVANSQWSKCTAGIPRIYQVSYITVDQVCTETAAGNM
jgi:quinol monooxygenase YgiN